ncbi:MAG TPA: hypothetical protein VL172_22435 [Kofleriaceae bacterium]|nr:hypothetical protein [Kofleriaceae bacterium]
MRAWLLAIVVCLGTATAAVRPAAAQPTDQDKQNAKKAWDKAQAALKKGEWAIAQREFGTCYEVTKDPVMFYWIAYAHDKGGNCDAATIYYRRYIKEGKPGESDRKRSEDAIARCEGGAKPPDNGGGGDVKPPDNGGGGAVKPVGDDDDDGGTGLVKPTGDDDLPPPGGGGGPPSDVDTKPSWKWTAAWISVGGTVAFATAGAVLGLSAKSRQEDIENLIQYRDNQGRPASFDPLIQARYDDLVDEGKKLDRLSKISFAVAGGAAAAAVLFFVLDHTSSKHAEGSASRRIHLAPAVAGDGAGLTLGWEL